MSGFLVNYRADITLLQLRGQGETGYKIPRGGLFELVSGANFAGECLEWLGFGLAGWSLPSFAFALYTLCNLAPRALRHHLWYIEKFKEEYPCGRKALIPFLW
ncbi:unnamed protein product [Choristocarpus tenellus]